ncbi:MAG: cytochrome c maturation protein CcmE [Proteobacteria bacterium]|uniref:Cytochrome c-type biogenesis protein CcmE n=1 Tax=Candidatus Fonsibacter lacus TaxID=2576439 RepID=A0A964XRT1_9PROT|nr:cytochrome c maturation protein CcmE [Candidatus Fonsibacter lacus]NBP59569.1 cytochrome c maturation protein CcmE [Pseudomonadota bacterium]NCU71629.1 cytochrome c maturation protein CcmE [Candidatus Fonsibacter lacus]
MIVSKSTKNRLKIFSLITIATSIIFFFIYNNLQKNVVYFYAPQEIKNLTKIPSNKIRLGGLVKEGSLKKNSNTYVFIITDLKNEIFVEYNGLLPNLFIEGKSAVVEGLLKDKKYFIATTILAKHDENYMPPEVANSLKKNKLIK